MTTQEIIHVFTQRFFKKTNIIFYQQVIKDIETNNCFNTTVFCYHLVSKCTIKRNFFLASEKINFGLILFGLDFKEEKNKVCLHVIFHEKYLKPYPYPAGTLSPVALLDVLNLLCKF